MERIIPKARGIIHSRRLVVFINHDDKLEDELLEKLEQYARENKLVIGMSDTGDDNCNLSDLLREADLSVCIGRKVEPDEVLVPYSSCRRYYVYEMCSRQENWKQCLHPCIAQLHEYDEGHKSELLPTIFALAQAFEKEVKPQGNWELEGALSNTAFRELTNCVKSILRIGLISMKLPSR